MNSLSKEQISDLIGQALCARKFSYSPYSGFRVGATLLCKDGTVFQGCNIENAGYSGTNCAERTAFFKAVSMGIREFNAIAIVGGKADGEVDGYAYPCGVCRQIMAEFCSDDFIIIVAKSEKDYRIHTLSELLPERFGPVNLG